MLIPAIKRAENNNTDFEVHMIDVQDIWYVSVDSNKFVVYHTEHDKYYQPSNMEQVLAFLKEHDFEKLDRGMVVNIPNIKHFDHDLGKIYFEEEVKNDSKYATVSYSKLNKLKNILESEKDSKKNGQDPANLELGTDEE